MKKKPSSSSMIKIDYNGYGNQQKPQKIRNTLLTNIHKTIYIHTYIQYIYTYIFNKYNKETKTK